MTRICPVCKSKLSLHAPEGYCPECAAKETNAQAIFVVSEAEIRKAAQFQPGSVTPAAERWSVSLRTDDLGIDILLLTYEELAAIAAERPEINAAMQSCSYQITWKGVPVVAVGPPSAVVYWRLTGTGRRDCEPWHPDEIAW
jgi:hypothetical protein